MRVGRTIIDLGECAWRDGTIGRAEEACNCRREIAGLRVTIVAEDIIDSCSTTESELAAVVEADWYSS